MATYSKYKDDSIQALQSNIHRAVQAYQDPNVSSEKKDKLRELIKDFRRELGVRETLQTRAGDDGWFQDSLEQIDRYVHSFGKGVTLGYGEEIAAGLESLFSDKSYDELLDEKQIVEEAYKRSKEDYDSGAGHLIAEVGGSFVPGIGAVKAIGGVSKGIRGAGKVAGVGGVEAGLYGASGPGTIDERLEQGAQTAPFGLIAGALAPAASRVLSKVPGVSRSAASGIASNPSGAGGIAGGTIGAGSELYDQVTDPEKEFDLGGIAAEGVGGAALGTGLGYGAGRLSGRYKPIVDSIKEGIASRGQGVVDNISDSITKSATRTTEHRLSNVWGNVGKIVKGKLWKLFADRFGGGKGIGTAGDLLAASGRKGLIIEFKDLMIKFANDSLKGAKKKDFKKAVNELDENNPDEAIRAMRQSGIIPENLYKKINPVLPLNERIRRAVSAPVIPGSDVTKASLRNRPGGLDRARELLPPLSDKDKIISDATRFTPAEIAEVNKRLPKYAIGGVIGKFATKYGNNLYKRLRQQGLIQSEADELASLAEARVGGFTRGSTPADIRDLTHKSQRVSPGAQQGRSTLPTSDRSILSGQQEMFRRGLRSDEVDEIYNIRGVDNPYIKSGYTQQGKLGPDEIIPYEKQSQLYDKSSYKPFKRKDKPKVFVSYTTLRLYKQANPKSKANSVTSPKVIEWAQKNGKPVLKRTYKQSATHEKKITKGMVDQRERERILPIDMENQIRNPEGPYWNYRGLPQGDYKPTRGKTLTRRQIKDLFK